MGIKDLWLILEPLCDRKPLHELQGKTVAVDLSGWICEAQNIPDHLVQPKMYLRNLYFRACFLLLMDVTPVFVLEGKAPALKQNTLAARKALRTGIKNQSKDTDATTSQSCNRNRLVHTLKLCKSMLQLMGLQCVQGRGEAEALCAQLNANQLVDGIISQDSDCFAYGALTLYRNFSLSSHGGGSVDVYRLCDIQKRKNLGRKKMIALALLCGCDYSDGVPGVGRETALKLLEHFDGERILERMRQWNTRASWFEQLDDELQQSGGTICSECQQPGNVARHRRRGCPPAILQDHGDHNFDWPHMKIELTVRRKALERYGNHFPDVNLLDEFLNPILDDVVIRLQHDKSILRWHEPDMAGLISFMVQQLGWESVYCVEKCLPLVARWHVIQPGHVLRLMEIVKIRNPKGVPSYEVQWQPDMLAALPVGLNSETDSALVDVVWRTIEPQHLVQKQCPAVVKQWEECNQKKKTKRSKQNGTKETNAVSGRGRKRTAGALARLMGQCSLTNEKTATPSPVPRKRTAARGKRKQDNCRIPTGPLDRFIFETSNTSTPMKKTSIKECSFNEFDDVFEWDRSRFGDESDLMDLSHVVDGIVGGPPNITHFFDAYGPPDQKQDMFELSVSGVIELLSSSASEEEEDLDVKQELDDAANNAPNALRIENAVVNDVVNVDNDDSFDVMLKMKPLAERIQCDLNC